MPTVNVNVAADPPNTCAHVDLTSNVITEVRFVGTPIPERPINSETVVEVEVVVHASGAPVYFTTDGTDPSVRGTRSYVLPAAPSSDVRRPTTFLPTVVKLVSSAAATVSVQRVR